MVRFSPHVFRRSVVPMAWMVMAALGLGPGVAAQPVLWTDTVVTPRKSPESWLGMTRAVTVITSEELEDWGTALVGDALRHVAGVYVRRAGGIGRSTTAVIRGSGAAHVLVLIDGIEVNGSTIGSFDFWNLTTDNIDRIEVLRGSASTLYGSEAIGGVIQIFTKDGRGPAGVAVIGEVGSDRTFREAAELQWSSDRSRVSASISRLDSNGVSDNDEYRNLTYSGRSVTRLTDAAELDVAMRFHKGRVGISDGAFRPDPNRRNTEEFFVGSGTIRHQLTDWWQQSLQVGMHRSDLIDLDPSNPDVTEDQRETRFVTELFSVEWRHDLDWAEWGGLTSGFEVKSEQGDIGSFDKSALTWAWYLQPHVTLWDRLTLLAGTRVFRHNAFGRDATWELSAAYLLGEHGPKIRAGYSEGFHAPTLNDLYFPGFGNPDLKPEESRSLELGLDHVAWDDRLNLSVSLFHREVDELIQFTCCPFIPVNLGETEQQGFEIETALDLGRSLSLKGHYTYLRAFEEPSKEELIRIPQQTASLALRYAATEDVALDLRYSFVSSREEFNRERLKHYGLVDLGCTVRLNEDAELYARVDNLFNRPYQEIIGFPASGARVYFGGRVRR